MFLQVFQDNVRPLAPNFNVAACHWDCFRLNSKVGQQKKIWLDARGEYDLPLNIEIGGRGTRRESDDFLLVSEENFS